MPIPNRLTLESGSRAGKDARERIKERQKISAEWKAFRRKNLLSRPDLAKIIGVSAGTVYLIETQGVTPQYRTLQKFETLKKTYQKENR